MTSIFSNFALALVLCVSLAACGGSASDDGSGSSRSGVASSTAGTASNSSAIDDRDDASPALDDKYSADAGDADPVAMNDGDDNADDGSDGGSSPAGGGQPVASAGNEDVAADAGDPDAADETEQVADDSSQGDKKEHSDEADSGKPDSVNVGAGDADDDTSSNPPVDQANNQGSEWYQQFVADGANFPDNGVVSFQAISGTASSQNNVPVTLGQVFRKGDVPKGQDLSAVVDGSRVPAQVDAKATWPDGSLKHAVVTVRLPDLQGNASPVVTLVKGSATGGGNITLDQLLDTSFDATARITVGGKTYEANARDLLREAFQSGNCSDWGKNCKRWLSGPLASEWIVGGALADGGAGANLSVYFHVRAYGDGGGSVTRARVDTVIENDLTYIDNPRNETYDARIEVGDQSYQIKDLEHYRQARWHRKLWWGTRPNVYARANGKYLQATGAVSRYADVTPNDKFLNARSTGFPPMDHGDQTRAMGSTGAQPAIGPLPRWTSVYIVSTKPRAFAWMIANDDAVGSYSFHYRDQQTGRPLEITRHPYVTIANLSYARRAGGDYHQDLLPSCSGSCGSSLKFDIPHHPSIGYVPYLVTGDFYYLEEMQFTASYIELWANPGYRGYEKGLLTNGPYGNAQSQVRGQAWGLRSLADAAFATPDDDPMKSYFMTLVKNNLASYNATYTEKGDSASPLHVLNRGGAVIYKKGGQQRTGIAPWQQDFFTWAVGHAAEQGFSGAKPFLDWLSTFPIGRMTNWQRDPDSGYCWLLAATYSLRIRDVQNGPDYASLDRAYHENEPDLVGLDCNSQEMVNVWEGGRYQRGEMSGYADTATGFPSNFQIALAVAVESGIERGQEAWRIFDQRSVKPNYANYPNFAVVPRN